MQIGSPFKITASSRLGDIPLEPYLEQPRSVDEQGRNRVDIFIFCCSVLSQKPIEGSVLCVAISYRYCIFAFNAFTKSLFICESSSAVAPLGVSFFSVQLKIEIDTRIDNTNKVKFAFIFSRTPLWYCESENHTNEDAHTDADR